MSDKRFAQVAAEGFAPVFAAAGTGPEWDDLAIPAGTTPMRPRPMFAIAGAALVAGVAVIIAVLLASGLRPEDPQPPVDTTDPATTTILDSSPTTTSPESPTTTVAPVLPSEPVHGGSVTIALDGDLVNGFTDVNGEFRTPSLNPLLVGSRGAAAVARLVVPGAYTLDAGTGEVRPWLVNEIPRTTNGGVVLDGSRVTVTYMVRDEAVWEDGTPVTGEDLAFTYRLIASLNEEGLARTWSPYDLIDPITMVADGKSFSFDLTRPDPAYETLFEVVLPAHLIDPSTFADDWNDRLWPSAGPFSFVSFDRGSVERGSTVVVERNSSYWDVDPVSGEVLPYLDQVTATVLPDASSGVGFSSGSVDAVLGQLVSTDAGSFSSAADDGAVLHPGSDTLYEVLLINLEPGRFVANPDSLNDRADYRAAVLAAIDRLALATDVEREAVGSIAGIAVDAADSDVWDRYDDPAAVPGLLADLAPDPSAVYTSSSGDETIRIGEAAAALLTAAGIETTTEFSGEFFSQMPAAEFDIYAMRLFPGTGGLSGVAHSLAVFDPSIDSQFPIALWGALAEEATRYSEVVAAARAEVDQQRLLELITEAERILADNAVLYPLVRKQPFMRAWWPDRIQGIAPNRHQQWDTWNAAQWWRPAP